MAVFCRSLNSWRRAAWLTTFVTVFTVSWVVVARAQTQTPPYSLFQYSTLTSSGNTITATRVPVLTTAGITIYKNVTLQFDVDSDGNLALSSGYPQIFDAPTLLVSSFKAGRYVGPSTKANGKAIITVNGPGVSDGGATQWSLIAPTGADTCTYPGSANWYVGPIENNPYAARLKKAGITSTAWSYGVAGSTNYCGNRNWDSGTLIGVSQTGNSLTIVSLSTGGEFDRSAPIDQITYTLAP